jgi:glycosyltransferase involved in cell wall biosynthesis
MAVRTVLVCETQVPFVGGGAESLVRQLVDQLRVRGYETDRVSVPFKWYPKPEILPHAAAWGLLDLSESNGRPIDLLIATKFPTYLARHPRKVCWLVHQHRAAYELTSTPYSDFRDDELDVALRDRLMAIDERALSECTARYTISRTVTARLAGYNGLDSTPLYHPPRLAPRLTPGPYGDYLLSVSRIEQNKRVDLAVQSVAWWPEPLSLVVVGEGSQRQAVEKIAEEAGVARRVRFVGAVRDDDLLELYRGALAVVYVPYDEDYGLVTLEGFGRHARVRRRRRQRCGRRARAAGDRRGGGPSAWPTRRRRHARRRWSRAGAGDHLGSGHRAVGVTWLTGVSPGCHRS